jgi:hypothetical protein
VESFGVDDEDRDWVCGVDGMGVDNRGAGHEAGQTWTRKAYIGRDERSRLDRRRMARGGNAMIWSAVIKTVATVIVILSSI